MVHEFSSVLLSEIFWWDGEGWSWSWRRREETHLRQLVELITAVRVSSHPDRLWWNLEQDGEFFVRSVRRHIDDFMLNGSSSPTLCYKVLP
ncbi:hypothetical protein LXL04_024125 [Taraxacum kok-saghyz]